MSASVATWLAVRASDKYANPSHALHQLLDSAGAPRFLEARWGYAFPHRPFARATDRSAAAAAERALIATRLDEFAKTVDGQEGHASAARALFMSIRDDPAAAIELLKEAVYLQPDEASYWCDLAAVSLQRGLATDLLQALDAATRALDLDPSLEPAAFNRALALEQLGLLDDALEAWAALETTATGGWKAEAREHRAKLAEERAAARTVISIDEIVKADESQLRRLARDDLDRVRQVLEDELVPKLGAACSAKPHADCSTALNAIVEIAGAMSEASPDAQPEALATQLLQWGADGIGSRRAAVMVAYGDAIRTYFQDNVTAAAVIFKRLAVDSEGIVAVQVNARYYACLDHYYRAQHDEARQCLTLLERDANRRRFLFLYGRIEWLRAQISMTEGNLAGASAEFNRAIAGLREARDRNQTAAVESLRATLREQVGELIPAWQDRINALTRARLDARRRHTLFGSAARSCLLQQLPLAAHRFQQAVVKNARDWGQPGALVEAHLNLAVIEQRLGRPNDALESLETARRYFDAVSDARARGRFESELFTMEGEVLAQIAPEKGLAVLGQASARLSALQFNLMRARVEHARGAAAERLGLPQEAVSAYLRGVDELERQREPLAASAQMQSLDLAWDIYERLITRRLYDEGPDAAFATIESARAQVLRRFLPSGEVSAPEIADLPQRLPAGMALLYFSVLERETIRWTVTRSGVTLARIPVDRQRVDYLVRRYRRVLDTAGRSALDRVARPLLEVVLPPDLRATTVYVIPDGPLHELPFAALWNPTTRRFLIEEAAIGVAPSLQLFLSASRAARERFGRLDSALVVRGRMGETPGLDPLPVLPWAADELTATARSYAHARTLAGNTATASGFLGEAGRYPVVHFTGHALADRLAPDLSRLFFEPAHAGDSGWLLLRDLEQASFEKTALVVLAACETGAGRVLRGEGVMSLARPFLGKGVGGVVYSLWKVADEPSMRLLTAFHTGLRDGLEPIVALQRAQQSLIADSRTPDARRTWPAFQYAGGASGLD